LAIALIIIYLDAVQLAGSQCDGGCIIGAGMIGPVVDEQLSIHPQADAIVRSRGESVGLAIERLDLAGPAHREHGASHAWIWAGPVPCKVDGRIDLGADKIREINIAIVGAPQASSSAYCKERRAERCEQGEHQDAQEQAGRHDPSRIPVLRRQSLSFGR
jgi:hypothetical protein